MVAERRDRRGGDGRGAKEYVGNVCPKIAGARKTKRGERQVRESPR